MKVHGDPRDEVTTHYHSISQCNATWCSYLKYTSSLISKHILKTKGKHLCFLSSCAMTPSPKQNSTKDEHIGPKGRQFTRYAPVPCYDIPPHRKTPLPPTVFSAITELSASDRELLHRIHVPPKDARAFHVPAGSIFRVEVVGGSQVADVNVWNASNPRERFYSSKTRQLHASHLTTGDSLWSCMPYLRPLATVVTDTIAYGIDQDNAGVHDVIGSRCDPYTNFVMTGENAHDCCHSNLTRAVLPFGLTERDVHDVFNVFMCTGFMRHSGQYFTKPSPAVKGDFLEMFAHFDLLVAVGACPQGDVSIACGSSEQPKCFPLEATVFRLPEQALVGWVPPEPSRYTGAHGLMPMINDANRSGA